MIGVGLGVTLGAVAIAAAVGGAWILASNIWDDGGVWDDSDTWND